MNNMNNLRVLCLMLFCWTNLAFAQNYSHYYSLCNKAYTFYANKDYKQATITYKQAFKENFPFPDDVDFARKCYMEMNNKKEAFKMLKLMVKSGYSTISETTVYTSSLPKRFLYLVPIGDSILETKFAKKYPQWRKQYLKKVDLEADKYLQSIKIVESFVQRLRTHDDTSRLFEDAGFYEAGKLLVNLLKYNNNISRHKTDCWGDGNFLTAIFHDVITFYEKDTNEFDEFCSLLKEQIIKGNLHPMQYAEFYDAIFDKIKIPIKYGQHIQRYLDDDNNFNNYVKKMCPIQNIEQIDAIRAEIFLPPLWAYCLVQNLKAPENYRPDIK